MASLSVPLGVDIAITSLLRIRYCQSPSFSVPFSHDLDPRDRETSPTAPVSQLTLLRALSEAQGKRRIFATTCALFHSQIHTSTHTVEVLNLLVMNQDIGVPASKKTKVAHPLDDAATSNGHRSNGTHNGTNGSSNNDNDAPHRTSQGCIELEEEYSAHNYHPMPVVFSRASGAHVYDPEGKKYIDCLSAYSAVNQVGSG